MSDHSKMLNIFDFEKEARRRIESTDYDFIAGGATDEVSVRRTRLVLDEILLQWRVLTGAGAEPTPEVTILGKRREHPIIIGPTGLHGRVHPDGEVATVKGAGSAGALMILSSGSSFTLEEVAAAASGPVWFQQYLYKDRGLTSLFANRASCAGYEALVVTVDAGARAKRERDLRNRYVIPASPNYAHITSARPVDLQVESDTAMGDSDLVDTNATWDDLAWLAGHTSLPIVLKGVMSAEDAWLAHEHGAAAVVVSNHGGRQLDTCPAPIEVLPSIADRLGDQLDILVDGGMRRGTDVVKALALGAQGVLLGRPTFWGLAIAGDVGVQRIVEILHTELVMSMAMLGVSSTDQLTASMLSFGSPLQGLLCAGRI